MQVALTIEAEKDIGRHRASGDFIKFIYVDQAAPHLDQLDLT